MKKIACLLSVLVVLTASVAVADIVQFTGATFEARITDPVDLGFGVVAFDLIFENISGDAGGNPFNFDGGLFGPLHQATFFGVTNSPTLSSLMAAHAADTHFNLLDSGITASLLAPVEDANLAAPSAMPVVGPVMVPAETFVFGTNIQGIFTAAAARPAGPLRTPDWNIMHVVTTADALANGGLTFSGDVAGETLAENMGFTFTAVPEPATMSLLAIGGVAALIRRRK